MKAYATTRDLIVPAGTRLIHLNGRLVFGSADVEPGLPLGLSTGLDTALERGLIVEASDDA